MCIQNLSVLQDEIGRDVVRESQTQRHQHYGAKITNIHFSQRMIVTERDDDDDDSSSQHQSIFKSKKTKKKKQGEKEK